MWLAIFVHDLTDVSTILTPFARKTLNNALDKQLILTEEQVESYHYARYIKVTYS